MAINDPSSWLARTFADSPVFHDELHTMESQGWYDPDIISGGAFTGEATWAGSLMSFNISFSGDYSPGGAWLKIDGSGYAGSITDNTAPNANFNYEGDCSIDISAADGVGVLFYGQPTPNDNGQNQEVRVPDTLMSVYENGGTASWDYSSADGWQFETSLGGLPPNSRVVLTTAGTLSALTGEMHFTGSGEWGGTSPFSFNSSIYYSCYPQQLTDGTPTVTPTPDTLPDLLDINWFTPDNSTVGLPTLSFFGFAQGGGDAVWFGNQVEGTPDSSSGTFQLDLAAIAAEAAGDGAGIVGLTVYIYDNSPTTDNQTSWFSFAIGVPPDTGDEVDVNLTGFTDESFPTLRFFPRINLREQLFGRRKGAIQKPVAGARYKSLSSRTKPS